MPGCASKIHEAPLRKNCDSLAIRPFHLVDLRLNLDAPDFLVLKYARNVDLQVKMTDIGNNRLIFHRIEMFAPDDIAASRGSDENVAVANSLLKGGDLVAFHRRRSSDLGGRRII